MPLEGKPFDAITFDDIQELVDHRISENMRLDYKEKTYGKNENNEFMKDISAFANTEGGHLVLGVTEEGGEASGIQSPLDKLSFDKEILRLESIAQGIDPRITGLKMKEVKGPDGKDGIIVIRIPRSWNIPHRAGRFHRRNSKGTVELGTKELAMMFRERDSIFDKAQKFHADRTQQVRDGSTGESKLQENGQIILHIIPYSAFEVFPTLDVQAVKKEVEEFSVLSGYRSSSCRFNHLGILLQEMRGENLGDTQLFRNGVVELTQGNLKGRSETSSLIKIGGSKLEQGIVSQVESYMAALERLGVSPPFLIFGSMYGMEKVKYFTNSPLADRESKELALDTFSLQTCFIEGYSAEQNAYRKALMPMFDALWNAIGLERCMTFDTPPTAS